jgi:hypothetical protein
MYSHRKKTLQTELALFEFKHPFGTALDPANRWVRLAALVPWDEVEGEYSSHFGVSGNDAGSEGRLYGPRIPRMVFRCIPI